MGNIVWTLLKKNPYFSTIIVSQNFLLHLLYLLSPVAYNSAKFSIKNINKK